MYSNDNILMQYLYIATEYTHTLASYTVHITQLKYKLLLL